MSKNFTLNTDLFLDLWLSNLKNYSTTKKTKTVKGDWKKFVHAVMKDTGPEGISKTHEAYFVSTSGKAALKSYRQEYTAFHDKNGLDLPKDLDAKVKEFFYNEKCLDKCNAIRSKMKGAIRPEGWQNRPCVGKGGGAKKKNWADIRKEWKGFLE